MIEDQNFDGFSASPMRCTVSPSKRPAPGCTSPPSCFQRRGHRPGAGQGRVLGHGGCHGPLAPSPPLPPYAVGIFEPIQQLARNFADVISLQANIERVTDLLDREPDIVDSPEVVEKYGDFMEPKQENWEEIQWGYRVRDVSFRYPDGQENVLEHFNLKIPAGTNVAIVGGDRRGQNPPWSTWPAGSLNPLRGWILIDGRDYRERSQLWLHSNIGYMLQSPHLFPAASWKTSAMAGWRPPTRRSSPPRKASPLTWWLISWNRAMTATWGRAATASPPGKSS